MLGGTFKTNISIVPNFFMMPASDASVPGIFQKGGLFKNFFFKFVFSRNKLFLNNFML